MSTSERPEVGLREASSRATPGVWRQEFYRDGELLPDGTGGMDDYETPGSGVYVIDEDSGEGYCLTEFSASSANDAAFIVAAVNYVRALLAGHPAAEAAPPCIDADHLAGQRAWSLATFGPGSRLLGVLDHIRKELKEIEDDPTDVAEWVDVIILAFDGAWRAGWEPQQIIDAIKAKQARNEARTWPDWRTVSPDAAIEHIAEAAPTADERCDIARHARPHATWGDDPSGSCGCAGCDGCPCATPDAEAAPVCDDDACPGVGRACPYPAAGCGANDPEDAPTAGERACAACGVCPYARPATPDASGGLSVDERVELTDLVWPVNYADPDLDAICELVERIVAARVAAAETRARREHGEKIAQAIEAEQGRWDARFPTPEGWDLEYILRRAGTYSGLGKAAHIARSLSPDAAEGDGRGEG